MRMLFSSSLFPSYVLLRYSAFHVSPSFRNSPAITRTEHSAAQINPQTGKPYKYTNKYVGIHDPDFAKDLGASVFGAMSAGGSVVRVGERKVK